MNRGSNSGKDRKHLASPYEARREGLHRRAFLLAIGGSAALLAGARPEDPVLLPLEGDVEGVHDPVIMKEGKTYYIFCTGGRPGIIPIRSSEDLRRWTLCGSVFEKFPGWASEAIPKARDAWAPDISRLRGKYHLYYAVSTFGKNESVIGLATNETLNPNSPAYKWIDEGLVLRSTKADDWNAIDPNLVIEDEKNVWLSFGSYWSGLKMRRVDPATGRLSTRDTTLYSLASRPRTPEIAGSVEAPFIIRHGRYWYLFASFDFCCRGPKSNYKVAVGRSRKVTGPYVDKTGKPMLEGGGTIIVEAQTSKWHGAGHNSVLQERGRDYLVFHAYPATQGRPQLQISTIVWRDDWPQVAALP